MRVRSLYIGVLTGATLCIHLGMPSVIMAQQMNASLHATPDSVVVGATIVFSGSVSGGNSPFSFFLQHQSQTIDKKDSVSTATYTYSIQSAQISDAGSYSLIVQDSSGNRVTSNRITILVTTPPPPLVITSFSAQNTSNLVGGDTVTFHGTIRGGTKPYTCILEGPNFRETKTVTSSTDITQYSTIVRVSVSNNGSFVLSVSDAAKAKDIYKTPVTLSVVGAKILGVSPSSVTVNAGQQFSLRVTTQGEVRSYTWYNDDKVLSSSIPALTVNNAQREDAGNYTCRITFDGASGNTSSQVSSVVRVTVNQQPLQITSFTVNPLVVAVSGSVTFSATFSGGAVPYTAVLNGPNNFSNATSLNQTSYSYVLNSAQLVNSGNYFLTITDKDSNTVQSKDVSITVQRPPSIVVNLPMTAEEWTGRNYTFSLSANGDNLTYQWYYNNSAVQGQTRPQFSFAVSQISGGNFYCRVSNTSGSVNSNQCRFTVRQSATIIKGIRDTSVVEGTTVVFELTASGSGQLRYAWYKDGTMYSGSVNSQRLEIRSVKQSDAGRYRCDVSNNGGTARSNTATLTVKGSVTFILQPRDTSVYTGKRVVLTAVATGTPPLRYQWFMNGSTLANQTADSLVIDPVTSASAGKYQCVALNNYNSIDSSRIAVVTVLAAATIKTQPKSLVCDLGTSASFYIEAGGNPPFTYQWFKDSAVIEGAKTQSYTIQKIDSSHAGVYRCRVSNGSNNENSVMSDLALLSIRGPITFVKQPESKSAYAGNSVSLDVFVSGSDPKTYQWQRNGLDIKGETNRIITFRSVSMNDSGYYRCIAANTISRDTSSEARLTVLEKAYFVKNPESLSLSEGQTAYFYVKAQGSLPLYFQWYYQNKPKTKKQLKYAASDTLTIEQISNSDAGEYFCTITNDSTDTIGVSSSKARLSLIKAAISIVSPNGKEQFLMNENTRIHWICQDQSIKTVRIDFSADQGFLLNPIAVSVPNKEGDNFYEWKLPEVFSEFCRIKISNENGFQSDMSDENFLITFKIAIKDKKKTQPKFVSSLKISPNPVSRSHTSVVKFEILPLTPLDRGYIQVIDPLGTVVFTNKYSFQTSLPSKPFVFGSWNVRDVRGALLKPGTYAILVECVSKNGERSTVQALFGIQQ